MPTRTDFNAFFCKSVEVHGNRQALLFSDGRGLTYRELDRRATRLAHELRRRIVVEPGMIIGIHTHRSLDTIVAMLAVLKAGAAFAPLDPMYPRERIAYMLELSDVRLVLTEVELAASLDPTRYTILTLDRDLEPAMSDVAPLPTAPLPQVAPDDLAYVIFTSGSTGNPKGCMIPHRAFAAFLRSMIEDPGLSHDDRFLANASISFDMMIYEIFFPLAVGALVIIASREVAGDGRRLVEVIEGCGVTAMMATPATWRLLLAAGWKGRRGFHLVTAGEAVAPDLARQLLELSDRVWNMYGPTETTVIAAVERVRSADEPIPLGFATAGTRMFVVDPSGAPVASGEPGELWIGGPQVGLGYLKRPDLTQERFVPNRLSDDPASPILYRTGDLVRATQGGKLHYLGRIDGQVKIRGFRIELGEIEAKLTAWPEVKWAVVIAREDAPGDRRLVGYVVLKEGVAKLSLSELRQSLAQMLPDYMMPSHVVVLDGFPLTQSGKVDRKLLPAPFTLRASLSEPYTPPRSQLEERLAAVFAELLQYDRLGLDDPLFELGLNSLLVMRATAELTRLGVSLTAAEIFQSPTIGALAERLTRSTVAPRPRSGHLPAGFDRDVAIVGMAGRFPGAETVAEFWTNLRRGIETTTWFKAEDVSTRVPRAVRSDPSYVAARGLIGDVSLFDAAFFGINPVEAAMLDPQQRIFLEECWHALEDAGYVPERCEGRIGVYAGANRNCYFLEMLRLNPAAIDSYGEFPAMIAAEKDFVATRVAHRLDLTGPAVSVQTACSSSLVAVIEAVASLRDGRCDLALAGGVSLQLPRKVGHTYQEGGIQTRDGHCNPFAADATGTLWSDGVGVVLLRRLSDALAAGDHIYGVIKGVGLNNDGGRKASFAAPSIDGQLGCILDAQGDAGIAPEQVSYVEAHGTGTPIGDPIETLALKQAYVTPARVDPLLIGSVKGNFGHTVAAAGVAGLIKTAMSLRQRELAPTINVTEKNPACGFDARFDVQTSLASWGGKGPLLAGVSSFGVGGTNAHVLVAEAPRLPSERGPVPRHVLLPISARSPEALRAAASALTAALPADATGWALADAAWTLSVGRRDHPERAFVVVDTDKNWSAVKLEQAAPKRVKRARRGMVWMFPGQGAQYAGMARSLYEQEPIFRLWFDAAAARVKDKSGLDLVELVMRATSTADVAASLRSTCATQPAIFALSHALARTWLELGLRPAALIGHSVGEFVAAVLAGVMSFKDALDAVIARGELLESMPGGSMLAMRAGMERVSELLAPGCSLASINGPSLVVVAGPTDAIARTAERAGEAGIPHRLLETSHAFHSAMMEPAVAPLTEIMSRIPLRAPVIPIFSSVTGDVLSTEEACDPAYWGRHVREPVNFSAAAARARQCHAEFLEVGPRGALSTMVRQIGKGADVMTSLSPAGDPEADAGFFLEALGRLWQRGERIEWSRLGLAAGARRMSLPGYAFQRESYWNLPDDTQAPAATAGVATQLDPVEPLAAPVPDLAGTPLAAEGPSAPPVLDLAESPLAPAGTRLLAPVSTGGPLTAAGAPPLASDMVAKLAQQMRIMQSQLALLAGRTGHVP
jgi:amino acid adenylation domain-containing protein